jgi:hypothetical protein
MHRVSDYRRGDFSAWLEKVLDKRIVAENPNILTWLNLNPGQLLNWNMKASNTQY